jgi:hypothetical protein
MLIIKVVSKVATEKAIKTQREYRCRSTLSYLSANGVWSMPRFGRFISGKQT